LIALIAAVVALGLGAVGCSTTNKEGLSGPYVNMDEPTYDSSIERSKDRPAIEKETRVDFFKFKQGF